ncbi:MAG: GNAT family N-acetyltransferase, partial [Prevotella sp.]|nr:GNAT family N-acetyltransferase [Prevotella sp.]
MTTSSDITISPVCDKRSMRDFLRVPEGIYRGCPQYVPDWQSDTINFFNPRKNPGLEFSDVQGFVAYRHEEAVGRIVGIINRRANERWQVKNVRFSMIEFIDDLAVSRALIAAVEQWGREQGMQKLQGPMGIT